jgi:hypothetical protein
VQVAPAMRTKFSFLRNARDVRPFGPVGHPHPRVPELQEPSSFPAPGDILNEIGLLLAIHLAVALAVVLTVGALGL